MDALTDTTKPLESVRNLMTGAIDYAGLFPPAQLSMADAVLNYALNRSGVFNWMLGRFVLPVARLDEFLEQATPYLSPDREKGWKLSVLAGENISDTLKQIDAFNKKNAPGVVCDSLEVKAATISKIENTLVKLPENITVYFEVVQDEKFADLISTIALRGHRAKIRTGGVIPESFPKSKEVIRFVRTCAAANVPFKATAGLHHPIRCYRPLTYATDGPKGTMHGFLNVFLMTGFVRENYRTKVLEELMEEEFDEVFRFVDSGLRWRDEYTLNISQIENLRRSGIVSFGSCSFDEPVADLQALGIL